MEQGERIVKKFVFLTNQYLPKPGATGLCVHAIAREMVCRGYESTVVCYKNTDHDASIDGVEVINIPVPEFIRSTAQSKRCLMATRISKLIHLFRYPLRSTRLIRNYMNAVEKCIKGKTDITLMASYTPLEAVVAVQKIKQKYPHIKTVYYSTDTLSNEQGTSGILSADHREKCGYQWERNLFPWFDKILIMECHQDHYFAERYGSFRDKMELVNFPLIIRPLNVEQEPVQKRDKEIKTLVYAGTLYRRLRNPQYTCKLITDVSKELDLQASFLSCGDCEDILAAAVKASDGAICALGMQPHSVAMQYIASADVLLSIGNAESPMTPSKIYEYMSSGKPIVHIYTYEKDPCIPPLQKYGNALLIKENEIGAAEKFKAFLDNARNLRFEQIEEKFITSTPRYSADIIEAL